MQAAAQCMTAGGRIITISSAFGNRFAFAGGAVDAAIKTAVVGLALGEAWDLGPHRITVNVVAPSDQHGHEPHRPSLGCRRTKAGRIWPLRRNI
ncbi:SDR family oxidoreductase [Bradyrhizobium yuanmingense]|uniref:SDR family oxidoreductase n=1 Tax=Bradyrhizobium yuanmingense TaxID=108015 RepID=UPI003F6AF824